MTTDLEILQHSIHARKGRINCKTYCFYFLTATAATHLPSQFGRPVKLWPERNTNFYRLLQTLKSMYLNLIVALIAKSYALLCDRYLFKRMWRRVLHVKVCWQLYNSVPALSKKFLGSRGWREARWSLFCNLHPLTCSSQQYSPGVNPTRAPDDSTAAVIWHAERHQTQAVLSICSVNVSQHYVLKLLLSHHLYHFQ